jgi:SRSO17 transposase
LSIKDRKSIEPIAIDHEGTSAVRNLTNFMSKHKWNEKGMLQEYQQELSEIISAPGGMITGDETDFAKKGHDSVGVARQYCGNKGKIDNCQASVMTGYANPQGDYGIIDYELIMPDSWFDDDHAFLRKKCGVPTAVKFQNKNDMMLKMIQDIQNSDLYCAKYVGVDSSFGSDSDFLDNLPKDLIYFADVRSNQHVFADRPKMTMPSYSGKGRKPTSEKPEYASKTVKEIAEGIPWNKIVLGNGSEGPVITKDKLIRVVEVRNCKPGKNVWLYVRMLDNGGCKYSLCNAPMDASFLEIRRPALMRWSIEQCFEETKNVLGMDHYEARSWNAWHRHILLTLIAHLFLIKLRIQFCAKENFPAPVPYVVNPVLLEDYLDCAEKLKNNISFDHPDIVAIPNQSLQTLSIGRIQNFVDDSLVKVGSAYDKAYYGQMKDYSAFESHARTKVNKAFASLRGRDLFDLGNVNSSGSK